MHIITLLLCAKYYTLRLPKYITAHINSFIPCPLFVLKYIRYDWLNVFKKVDDYYIYDFILILKEISYKKRWLSYLDHLFKNIEYPDIFEKNNRQQWVIKKKFEELLDFEDNFIIYLMQYFDVKIDRESCYLIFDRPVLMKALINNPLSCNEYQTIITNKHYGVAQYLFEKNGYY